MHSFQAHHGAIMLDSCHSIFVEDAALIGHIVKDLNYCIQMFDMCSASSNVIHASCEAFVDWWYSTMYCVRIVHVANEACPLLRCQQTRAQEHVAIYEII